MHTFKMAVLFIAFMSGLWAKADPTVGSVKEMQLEEVAAGKKVLLHINSCEITQASPPTLKCLMKSGHLEYAIFNASKEVAKTLIDVGSANRRRIPCTYASAAKVGHETIIRCSNTVTDYSREAYFKD
jgi:hypothetical protein